MDQNMDNSTPAPEEPSQPTEPQPQPEPQPEPQAAAPQPPEQPAAVPPTQPAASTEINKDAKMWGMFCHLAGLAGYLPIIPLIGCVIGPLILWLIKKDESTFIDNQGKEALNFQISILIYTLVSLVTICIPPLCMLILFGIGVCNLVFIIIASIESNKGTAYRYPISIRLIK